MELGWLDCYSLPFETRHSEAALILSPAACANSFMVIEVLLESLMTVTLLSLWEWRIKSCGQD